MKIIELIGPSGVGKTTLYNKIESSKLDKRFNLKSEAYCIAALDKAAGGKGLYFRILKLMLRSALFKGKSTGISKKILFSQKSRKFSSQNPYASYQASFNLLYNHLGKTANPQSWYVRIGNLIKKTDELILLNKLLPDTVVLFDEGLIHTNPAIKEEYFENYSYDELKSDKGLTPFALISCSIDPELIYEQALQRKRSGINTYAHGGRSDDELKAFVYANYAAHQSKVKFFTRLNVPVLEVSTHENVDIVIKKINNFIESINQQG